MHIIISIGEKKRIGMCKVFFLLTFIYLFLSCNNPGEYLDYKTIGGKWHKDSVVIFNFDRLDLTRFKNYNILIRNTDNYPFRNIYLFVTMRNSFKIIHRDTLEYELANISGKWLGVGIGDTKESVLEIPNYKKVAFGDIKYISIQHGMRVAKLDGVKDVGILLD